MANLRLSDHTEMGGDPAMKRALLLSAALLLATTPAIGQTQEENPGRDIFIARCASCHGAEGDGTQLGPDLRGVGAASADFQLRTGRMPLSEPGAQTIRKPRAFGDDQIRALVTYVATLADGPEIPTVDLTDAEVSQGSQLFANNCAACHGATANGGAVGENAFAPTLHRSEPLDVAEAMITGPGQMPVFAFDDQERDDIVAYVMYLKDRSAPGGLDIGGVGPVPEGYVAWALAMVILIVIVLFIGKQKSRGSDEH
jgi:ubiquinol-cytochrome c reductase cytochrome c subunit